MAKKPFNPLDTAQLRLDEIRKGQFVPSGAVSMGVGAGAPIALLLVEALGEFDVHLGPKTATLVGIAVSALAGYVTRDGRRFFISFKKKF